MLASARLVFDTGVRVQRFLDANAETLAHVNESAPRKDLDAALDAVTTHAVDQGAGTIGARGETAKQHALASALRRKHMSPIARIARAKLRDVPEFTALRMPSGKVIGLALVTAAESMADAARKFPEVFAVAGCQPGFVDRLVGAAADLNASLSVRVDNRSRARGATIGLKTRIREVKQSIALLDALVRQTLDEHDGLLAKWRGESRVPAKPGPAQGSALVPAVAPPPVKAA
jgi:hypothetical protein